MSVRRGHVPSGSAARGQGFTLVELAVTIAIVAILAAIAYPNMTGMINAQRLTSTTNELVGAIQIARNEAIRRNLRVAVCRSNDGLTCAGGGNALWTQWAVVAQSGPGKPFDTAVRGGVVLPLVQIKSTVANDTVIFRADGMARETGAAGADLLNTTMTLCIPKKQPPQNQRTLSIGAGSRVSSAAAGSGTGICP